MSLRASLDIESALHREKAAFVIEVAHLVRIDEDAALPVRDKCTVVPGVPQPAHDIDEFFGNFIAKIMILEPVTAEVESRRVHRTGDHIPGGSPMAHAINRGERSRDVIRLAETGRNSRARADLAGDTRQAG